MEHRHGRALHDLVDANAVILESRGQRLELLGAECPLHLLRLELRQLCRNEVALIDEPDDMPPLIDDGRPVKSSRTSLCTISATDSSGRAVSTSMRA